MDHRQCASVSAQQAADAANKIIQFDHEDDQEALLEVLDMYFCGPCNPSPVDRRDQWRKEVYNNKKYKNKTVLHTQSGIARSVAPQDH